MEAAGKSRGPRPVPTPTWHPFAIFCRGQQSWGPDPIPGTGKIDPDLAGMRRGGGVCAARSPRRNARRDGPASRSHLRKIQSAAPDPARRLRSFPVILPQPRTKRTARAKAQVCSRKTETYV